MKINLSSKRISVAGLRRGILAVLLAGVCLAVATASSSQSGPSYGIGEDYNPTSPGNPGQTEDVPTEQTYRLTAVANPSGTGYLSPSSPAGVKAGQRTYVSASANSGFVFINWTADGEEISASTDFYYTMPEHDVTLVANFRYDPASPGNPSPEEQKVKHPVTVRAIPSGAASVSPSEAFDMEENAPRQVYAYPNTGWQLTGWTVNGVEQAADTSPLTVTMGEKALDIVAHLEYNPASPSNPAANYYNPTTGQVIIDDFRPGQLYSALSTLVGSGSYSNVSSLIVKGKIDRNDIGILSNLSNAATIDLSRTGGVTALPSYAFNSMGVSDIVLPSTITEIGNYAFQYCENLMAITLYGQEPPVCSASAFRDFTNSANCTVFVPAAAIELYSAADGWKDFTILPISNDAHVLQVNLPADGADGRYKNNSLEIVNVNSGVRQKYVISDRQLYTFNGLRKDEQYNIYMYSQAGLEIGRIENVVIPERDIEVTFSDLKPLHTVVAEVLAPDGTDVTQQVSVEWLKPLADGSTTYLRKADSLGEIPEGQQLICRVTLDSRLGTAYANPEDVEFTVSADSNTCTVALTPFRSIRLNGTVADGNGAPLQGASVSASQMLNGRYTKTYTVKTDRKGEWLLTVPEAPETRLTYAATECVNLNDTIGAFAPEVSALDLGTATLRSIVGARVTYGFTYHAAGSDNVENFYSDYQNVEISVYNVTQARQHTDLSLQYPMLAVLDENINPGDELRLTATSRTGAFHPVTETVTVGDGQRAEVTFDIVGKGGVSATFDMTDNPAVTAMLYGRNGELLKKSPYTQAKVTFTELEDGEYTLVSMGQSDLMNSILRLQNFDEIGLTEGKDYVKNAVTVESGRLAEVRIPEVPAFDESLFYYTGGTTGFSANKSSITTGNYLTLRSSINFKGVYKNDISNVALVVDLPEACEMVEQSVIQGPNILPYTLDRNRLTIQLGTDYQTQTRFCVVPTTGGTFNATAYVVFDYNGKTVTQPIGAAVSEIKDLEISVPKTIASLDFTVSGIAQPQSGIEIYADGALVGKSKANAKGEWSADCVLAEAINLSTFNVSGRIETPSQTILVTENKEVCYDPSAVMPVEVAMTFWNGYYKKQYEVIWNMSDGSCNVSKYDFYTTTDLTFLVRFNTADPTQLRNIVLNVYTSSGSVMKLVPIYSETSRCWVAVASFSSSSLPENVSVDYEVNEVSPIDSGFMADNLNPADEVIREYEENKEWLDAITARLDSDLTEEEEKAIIDELCSRYGITATENSDEAITEESISIRLSQLPEDPDYLNNLLSASPWNSAAEDYTEGIRISNCDGITAEALIEQGFRTVPKTDGNDSYYLSDGTVWQFVDFESDIFITVDCQTDTPLARVLRARESDSAEGWVEKLHEVSDKIENLVSGIYGYLNSCNENLEKAMGQVRDELTGLENDRLWLEKNSNNIYLKKKIGLKIAAKTKVLDGLESTSTWLNKNFKQYLEGAGNASKVAGKAFSFFALIMDGKDAIEEVSDLISLRDSLTPPCKAAEAATQKLKESVNRWAIGAGAYYFGKLCCDVAEIGGVTAGIAALVPSGGTSTSAIMAAIVVMAGNIAADYAYHKLVDGFKDRTEKAYQKTQKLCKEKDPKPEDFPDNGDEPLPNDNSDTDSNHYSNPTPPVTTPVSPILDPSGYVYEAVPENRVEGVQATIYYKETKEDMYGDPYEEIVLWDAEEYAQKNPLFTDEYGMYQWDVPQGLWQVKFEKDGYLTAYSEWLPVPPPQLDVNIGIVQNKQPEVTEARAYEEGVEVQFDKYMDLSTLTPDNIYVSANGEKLPGEVRLIDSALADEYADEDDADAMRYASRVRFVPEEKISATTGEIRVTVSRNVLSYAGIPMTETYSQVLDVEKEVQAVYADDVKVLYGGEKEVTVFALPPDAAAGRTLRVATSSDLIASIDSDELTLDADGKTVVRVSGNLPGSATLSFAIDDVTATGDCAVDVVTEIITAEAPVASRASGTAVYRGTKVELTTGSKDAVIYFTTDGSCPCDADGTRRKYTVPIVIEEDTHILAMTSVGNSGDDVSETVEFNYTIKHSDIDFQMAEGWTWISHNLADGADVAELAADPSVTRILSQTGEAISDPQLGIVGTLTRLSAADSYKVETSAPTGRTRLSDVAWNPATPIPLNAGWNWLGYPVAQTMSVDEALAPTQAEELDMIVGQNGFAQYDGQNWIGTLLTMSPGLGYMYHSRSAKEVTYNTSIVSTAAARNAAGIAGGSPLVVDIRKYARIMPVVATLCRPDGSDLDNADYQVAAFCGSECRGIGRVAGGLVMMAVYGDAADTITLQVTDAEGSHAYPVSQSLRFSEDATGDIFNPYAITIDGDLTGIADVRYDGHIRLAVEGEMLRIRGTDAQSIQLVEIYDTEGRKLLRATDVTESGIRLPNLSNGVYVVTVKADGDYTYHRIAIR